MSSLTDANMLFPNIYSMTYQTTSLSFSFKRERQSSKLKSLDVGILHIHLYSAHISSIYRVFGFKLKGIGYTLSGFDTLAFNCSIF